MTDELIERFFAKRCTALEAAEVSDYLKQHPAVLEKYLSTQEWFNSGSTKMPEAFWDESWVAIREQKRPVVKMVWLKRSVAAAVILVCSGLLYKSLSVKKNPVALASVEKQSLAPQRKITVNNSTDMMNISLPDSSEVRLSPGSLITYYIPFPDRKREITLDGEARFKVMKNEQKPFTVYAGGLATTALGTEFTISTKNHVSVKLHTGRVMIRATGEAVSHWKKNVFLEPGQELNYSAKQMTAVVEKTKTATSVSKTYNVRKKKPVIAPEVHGLDFVNTSLADVMTKLTDYYHQQIILDTTGLSDMNFTGTISKDDSLSTVLKVIAQMNGLQLSHDDDGYQLKKEGK